MLAVSYDGEFYVPIYGGNGNIMGYVDESGEFAAKFEYDPYGDVISIEGGPSAPMPSPDGSPVPIPVGLRGEDFSFGFSTKYHDREVGLVAYQLRSYSPALGRWLNRDPIEEEGGVNLYVCLRNGCLVFNDLLGLSPYVLGSKIPRYGVTMRGNTLNSVRAKTAWSVIYRECVFFCAFLNMVGGFAVFYDDAAGNIHHYLKGGGDTKVIDFERMNFESIEAKRHYRSEVNDALRYAEKLVLSDNVPTAISTPNEASWAVNSGDWFYTVHNYRTWAGGTVTKCGNNYKMDWHFFFRDVYDWDANDGVGVFSSVIMI